MDGSTAVAGAIDAVSYGIPADRAAIAPSGRAEYALDFLGAQTTNDGVVGFTGAGTMRADFATGTMVITGQLRPPGFVQGFDGTVALGSAANSFSGHFQMDFGSGQLGGTIAGRFYGPHGEEVGATFTGSNGGSAVVGALLGRGAALPNEPFVAAQATAVQAGLSARVDGFTGRTLAAATRNLPLEVRFNSANSTYTLINNERSFAGRVGTQVTFGPDTDVIFDYSVYTSIRYHDMKAFRWTEVRKEGESSVSDYYVSDFIVGNPTADAALPRTGNAGYRALINGTVADPDLSTLHSDDGIGRVSGGGTLFADFGKGTLSTAGNVSFSSQSTVLSGRYVGSATISSDANRFAGTITMDGEAGNYQGSLSGSFYGATAREVGAAFSLTDGAGGVVSGTLLGAQDDTLTLNYTTLLDLTARKTFPRMTATGSGSNVRTIDNVAITYDPATDVYRVTSANNSTFNTPNVAFGPNQVDAARSDATYTVYQFHASGTTYDVTATRLNVGPTNPTIALSYVSFVDLLFYDRGPTSHGGFGNHDPHMTAIYGLNTPVLQLVRVGTGEYHGVTIGGGLAYGDSGPGHYYSLTGTNSFSVDFASFTFTGSTTLQGTEYDSGTKRDFGRYDFSGNIGNNEANNAIMYGHIAGGSLYGAFFGPAGPEIGVAFTIEDDANGEHRRFTGGMVAKRDQ